MTVTVFYCDQHKKHPTFTEVARKARIVHTRIMMVRSELRDIDTLLNDLHEVIVDLEEITIHD